MLHLSARKTVESFLQEEIQALHHVFTVKVDIEPLHIPVRGYYDPDRLRHALRDTQDADKHLLACMGKCHHDGFVRQTCLRELIVTEAPLAHALYPLTCR